MTETPLADVGTRSAAVITRQFNERRALDLLAEHGPASRTHVRDSLGVSQPTAIDLFKRLEAAGLIHSVGEERQTRPGPRALLYALVPGRAYVAAVNIRDRKITAAIGDVAGGPTLGTTTAAIDRGPLADQIAATVREAAAQASVDVALLQQSIVGVPGIVDPTTGDLGFSWDLPRLQGQLLDPLRTELPMPVSLMNGVHLAAYAEGLTDDLRGRQTFALVWVGTGVGSSLMINGAPLTGSNGAAGQIGYTPVPGAPVMPIQPRTGGFDGDLQALIGNAGLRALAAERGLTGTPASLLRKAASSVDPGHQDFLTEVAHRIAVGCASIASVVDPGLFVLQGSTALAGGEALAARVEQEFASVSPLAAHMRIGRVGENVELHGALHLSRQTARDQLWGVAAL
ncbi:ROK family transcriptional regulator [Microbacterium sp. GXF6406]